MNYFTIVLCVFVLGCNSSSAEKHKARVEAADNEATQYAEKLHSSTQKAEETVNQFNKDITQRENIYSNIE